MSERLLKVLSLGVFGSLLAALAATSSPAQEPIPLLKPGADPEPIPLPLPGQPGFPANPVQPAQGEGVEVLAKGPVHEAFATTAEAPTASPVVAKQPPDPIEELPPEQKPEGDNVQWIPGYWHWDEEGEKHIWISGFWRQPPPGRVWVPGSWREVKGGWQWVGGFWQAVNPLPQASPNQQVQPEIEYLPQPPQSLEVGPSVAAPGESYFYSPGCWVWRGRYVWRPGVWVEYRPNWAWVPARYHWSPAGYVFCEGYWDYPLARRGVLFAPVAFAQPIYARPAYVYTPTYVVSEPCMVGALFVRRGYGGYYFGDYFDNRYAARGYSAWCGVYTGGGFSIGFGVGRTWGYDPLWSYYSVAYRDTPTWRRGVGDVYHGRYRGDLVRPPTTLVQQNTTINNIAKVNVTNVTNNITVVNGASTVNNRDVSNVAMVAPLRVAPDLQRTRFQAVNAESRRSEAAAAKQIRDVGAQRTRLETAAVNQQPFRPPAAGQPAPVAQPKTIKLDVPKAAVARAQVGDEKKGPPPNPHFRNANPGAKVDPPQVNPQPKVDPKLPFTPKVDPTPKVNPQPPTPKVNPQPPVNPTPIVPKVNPQPLPKVEAPKVNPQPPVVPKVDPLPKVNPQPPVSPLPKVNPMPVVPKVDPKPFPKVEAPPVNPLPKVNPAPVVPKVDPKPPVGNPMPRVDPPRTNPPKTDPPKGNPSKGKPLAVESPMELPRVESSKVVESPKVQPVVAPPVAQLRAAVVPPSARPAPVVSPPAQLPKVVQPRVNPQPRPTLTLPAAQPPRVVQPPRAAQPPRAHVAPRAQPAPIGKPPAKNRR